MFCMFYTVNFVGKGEMRFSIAVGASVAVHGLVGVGIVAYMMYAPGPTAIATLDLSSVDLSFAENEDETAAVSPTMPAAPEVEPPKPREEKPPEAERAEDPPPPDPEAPKLAEPEPEHEKMETPELGKPVLVLRRETERPEAVDAGTVKLAGTQRDVICAMAETLLTDPAAYPLELPVQQSCFLVRLPSHSTGNRPRPWRARCSEAGRRHRVAVRQSGGRCRCVRRGSLLH